MKFGIKVIIFGHVVRTEYVFDSVMDAVSIAHLLYGERYQWEITDDNQTRG